MTCDVTQLWRHQAIKRVKLEYSLLIPLVQKVYKSTKNAGVIIENKVARFYGSRCRLVCILINALTLSRQKFIGMARTRHLSGCIIWFVGHLSKTVMNKWL